MEALEGTFTLHGRTATDFVKSYIEDGNKGPEWSCPNCKQIVNAKSEGNTCQNCGQKCSPAFFEALTSPYDPLVKAAPREVAQEPKAGQVAAAKEGAAQEGNHLNSAGAQATGGSQAVDATTTTVAEPKPRLTRRDSEAGDFLDAVLSTQDTGVDLNATLTHNAGQFQEA